MFYVISSLILLIVPPIVYFSIPLIEKKLNELVAQSNEELELEAVETFTTLQELRDSDTGVGLVKVDDETNITSEDGNTIRLRQITDV